MVAVVKHYRGATHAADPGPRAPSQAAPASLMCIHISQPVGVGVLSSGGGGSGQAGANSPQMAQSHYSTLKRLSAPVRAGRGKDTVIFNFAFRVRSVYSILTSLSASGAKLLGEEY